MPCWSPDVCSPGVPRRELVAVAAGPFETEAQARGAVRHIYAAAYAADHRGVMGEGNHLLLREALAAAGVELGSYDHKILLWTG